MQTLRLWHLGRLFAVFGGIVFFLSSTHLGLGKELLGKVVSVEGKQVDIQVEGEWLPQMGDQVSIGFEVPPIGFVALRGKWAISSINATTVTADPQGETKQPQLEQLVKIQTENPQFRQKLSDDAKALYQKGENFFYGRNGAVLDQVKAFECYRLAAEKGSADAMNSMGYMYGKGIGRAENKTKSLEWFRKAAKQSSPLAQRNLGVMYSKGWGVSRDDKIALKWYLKAADQGNVKAQKDLAQCYSNGKGVDQDDKLAARWYAKAADQGDAEAQCNLGSAYYNGKGLPQDYQKAYALFKQSADQEYAMAQNNLGVVYEYGKGVEKNLPEALRWYRKAAKNGYSNAQKALDRLGQ